MPYKISGTKSETARIIIIKESDWSIESNTVVSGSGSYEVTDLETGNKTVVARTNAGKMVGYGIVSPEYYALPTGDRGIFGENDVIDYITISTPGDATDFGDLITNRGYFSATSNSTNDRGVAGGGLTTGDVRINIIEYITISTTGNATDFGDLTGERYWSASCSNGTNNRGVFRGGKNVSGTPSNVMDYITISTTGDATDFGDATVTSTFPAGTANA